MVIGLLLVGHMPWLVSGDFGFSLRYGHPASASRPAISVAVSVFGDSDADGDVDLQDHAHVPGCLQGPGITATTTCAVFDANGDGDVDVSDFADLQMAYTGSATCGDGIVTPPIEECDTEGESSSCDADCTLATCGDGTINVARGEDCDDGNVVGGDGCSATCRFEDNDSCEIPRPISDSTVEFENRGTSTDGPTVSGACADVEDNQIGSDIWYCYEASCTGELLVSLCGSEYDTKLGVYAGCECPVGEPIVCSDDDCGGGNLESRVTLQVEVGQSYLIRVGGYLGARGNGLLTVWCGGEDCPADSGDCETPHFDPGCSDRECCEATCNVDRYCCDVEWDAICVDESAGVCSGHFDVCNAEAGDCLRSHNTPGCSDVDCCDFICLMFPVCCTDYWDELCAEDATNLCP